MKVGTIPKWKKIAVVAASVLFVGLSAWQVQARREDWPLSKFDMYSVKHGAFADRKVLYGVSPAGEFSLSEAGYRVSSKFWFQFSSIQKQKAKVRGLLAKVGQDYAALRRENPDVPELLALKVYRERWKIAPRMAGLDRMERKLLFDSTRDASPKTDKSSKTTPSIEATTPVEASRATGSKPSPSTSDAEGAER